MNKNIILAVTTVAIILVSVAVYFYSYPQQKRQPAAAIVDQLSGSQLTSSSRYPNQTFVETAKALLYTRFSAIDYYSDNATVYSYRDLPTLGYKMIIWRAHSALDNETESIAVSTSEAYGSKDYAEYAHGELTLCKIAGDPRMYFAITPKFIKESMNGRFEDTIVILMSCNGLRPDYLGTAEAFKAKGVRAFISWDGWVDPPDNDQGITLLLQHLIPGNETIRTAIDKIPSYSSLIGGPVKLDLYPNNDPQSTEYRIPSYKQDNTTSDTATIAVTKMKKIRIPRRSEKAH